MADETKKTAGASEVSADLQKSLEIIADVLLEKTKGGNALGGKPFDPSTAPAPKKLTAKERAKEYFASHNDFPHPGIHITSDGQIFLATPMGENALLNHVNASKVNDVATISFDSFKKPE
jgi:hypothetical protein